MMTRNILGGTLALAMAAMGGAALADYPEKPVKLSCRGRRATLKTF